MKNVMTLDQLDAQTALELPNREMLLVTVVIGDLDILTHNDVNVNVTNNKVAIQVCAIVEAINVEILGGEVLTCSIRQ
jgi:hypothetical protein